MKPHDIERLKAGDRLDELVALHVFGLLKVPQQWMADRPDPFDKPWSWEGVVGGRPFWECGDDLHPSRGTWDCGTVSWYWPTRIIERLAELDWYVDLEDHTRDTGVKPRARTWWYELCRYDILRDSGCPEMDGRRFPTHYWQLDGGHKDPHVALCHASLKAVLCADYDYKKDRRP